MLTPSTIFDLGFHNGDDTNFYLNKGFNVVAVEANPKLVKDGLHKFDSYIKNGQLILLNKAVTDKYGKINFYVHPTKTDWSSCLVDMAESDGSSSTRIIVDSISLYDLYSKYGVPYYLKVDIEGYDLTVAKHLSEFKSKPKFVSFELSKNNYSGIFSYLYTSGYSKFQLVNQMNNPKRIIPRDTLINKDVDFKFSEFSSGFFGNDLPEDKWINFNETITRYIKYKELKKVDNNELALGWLDIHAK